MNNKIDKYIETYLGKKFHFLDPDPDDIDMEDIAHSLSMQCRYTGHSKYFYSIAEHSMIVADLCDEENALWGLLHDASEAYLTDLASPIKQFLPEYKKMEKVLMDAIATKFGLELTMPEDVHICDRMALLVEAKELMFSAGEGWLVNDGTIHVPEIKLDLYDPTTAKKKFLETFEELK